MIRRARPKFSKANEVLSFVGFPHGLNSYLPIFQIQKTEASVLVNWNIRKAGQLVTRDAISRLTTASTTSNSPVIAIAQVRIGSTDYILLQDANYNLYYLDSDPKPVLIGSLSSRCEIISYNGVAVLLDGDYIKYIDDLASIKIAYDDGTGTRGYQFDHTSESQDSSLALGNGTNTRIAAKFTSQDWTSGYTIPPTTVSAYLSKTGSPTGSITVSLRKVSDDSVLATKTFLADVSELTGTITLFTATFSSSDITTEMSPNTEYYLSLEYSGGDASNYVNVHCSDVTSGGSAYYYDGSWHNDSGKNPLMSLRPGKPPKAAFGAVKDLRLFVAGDPDNPGYVWFSNYTHLDWSTPNGGGYIGAIDDNKNSYAVGGIEVLYGDLIIYGTQNQPYISKLTGTSPANYALPLTFQRIWTTHRTLVNTINDLWAGSADGIDALSGVQEYGDLRTFSAADPIKDKLDDYWDSDTAFAAYYPKEGQYWLVMPSYHRVLVCHTRFAVADPYNQGTRYPWAEHEYYRDVLTRSAYQWTASSSGNNEYYLEAAGGGDPGIATEPDFISMDGVVLSKGTLGSLADHQWGYGDNDGLGFNTVYIADASGNPSSSGVEIRSILLPTALASTSEGFLLGGSDGYIYKVDPSEYKDLGLHQINPQLGSAYIEIPFTYANFTQLQLVASSFSGGQLDIELYADGRRAEAVTDVDLALAVSDTMLVDEATMDVDDAYFAVDVAQSELFKQINFNARSVMFLLTNVRMAGYPIYVNGLLLRYRRLSH